ncbi:MAG: substrate-binding domain-containing protein [Nitrospirales bacterium]|nr:substrate-binding domain-containing protein [Nitrospira sp.]MBA3966014.1 substrate-binding domain-containing protein [Nitrospirales bacterium]
MHPRISGFVCAALLCLIGSPAWAEVNGSMVITGNGPEQRMMESLARAFEKANPRAYLDILWDDNSKPIEMVKAKQAQIAVTGTEEKTLQSFQIGWDGMAIMVHQSNFTKEVTTKEVGELFSGKFRMWADLGGPDTKVLLIDRPRNQNNRDAFEQQLGISGKIPEGTKVIAKDEKVIKTIAGTLPPLSAVAYVSMGQALEAVASGVPVRLLPVDKVEPETPTVRDGRYSLRRPVLLLSNKEPDPLVEAFQQFALSDGGQKIISEFYTPLTKKPSP